MVAQPIDSLPEHWRLRVRAPADHFTQLHEIPRFLVQLAYNRGLVDPADVRTWLAGGTDPDPDPALLPDLDQAVARIARAIAAGEPIAVYGDFDFDGVTGAALLIELLRGAGVEPIAYIPHRSEGHGLNLAAIGHLADQGVRVIVTADCGTNDLDEAIYAAERGIDLIVTDHHACSGRPIPALAVVNPNRPDSAYPFGGLAGVGVAYQLARAMIGDGLAPGCAEADLIDLAALGTLADVAPLTGPNRWIVRRGLERLAERPRLGLRALIDRIRLGEDPLTALTVTFQIAPRFNAAGRLDHAVKGLRLLTTRDPAEAAELAAELDRLNRERQAALAAANARLDQILDPGAFDLPILMVEDPDLPEPLLGLLASRLVTEYARPAIVVRWEEDECRASARAPAGYDLAEALAQCAGLLVKFGGHAAAAGFAIRRDRLGELRERLCSLLAAPDRPARADLAIDLDVDLRHHNWRILEGLQRLAPFGQANPEPTFLSRRVRVVSSRRFGPDDKHLRLNLYDNERRTWSAVAFNRGADQVQLTDRIHLVYHLRDHRWNGEHYLQLHVLDLVPAGHAG